MKLRFELKLMFRPYNVYDSTQKLVFLILDPGIYMNMPFCLSNLSNFVETSISLCVMRIEMMVLAVVVCFSLFF